MADNFCDMTLDSYYKQQTANVLVISPPDLDIESTNEQMGFSFHYVISKYQQKLKQFAWEMNIEVHNS